MSIKRPHGLIRNAEWICWTWIDVTEQGDTESMFIRGRQRPLDEAMKLAGGSIRDLEPYLWALSLGPEGANDV